MAKNDHWLHHRVATVNPRRLIVFGITDNGTAHNGTAWTIS